MLPPFRLPLTLVLVLVLSLTLVLFSCAHTPETQIRSDLKKHYDAFQVQGSFALYDPQADTYVLYNPGQFGQAFTPASTFKICNSLIGLETGVIQDENFVIPWDSVMRQNPDWNSDHDLKTAFRHSTVWYYQELARRVGGRQMKYWLDMVPYGNADTSGGIDRFWLSGGLRISPRQQIDFLQRLHESKLPFSQRSIDIVKKIMVVKDTLGYTLSAKTGWGTQDNLDIGWYVGYLEKNNKVWYFANCIQSADPNNKEFVRARIEIFYRILNELKPDGE